MFNLFESNEDEMNKRKNLVSLEKYTQKMLLLLLNVIMLLCFHWKNILKKCYYCY